MIKDFFKKADSYREQIAGYNHIDGLLAILFYAVLMVIYYFMGLLSVRYQLYLGIPVNLLLIFLCLILVRARKQKLTTIGITADNIGKSAVSGLVFGVIATLVLNVIPSILAGGKIITFSQALYNLFYYFIIISLTEEIVFRGYIQTRIYGLIKQDVPAILLTAFLFYAMHLPFQMAVSGMQINIVNMLIMMGVHIVTHLMYRKYNSLTAPTIFHGLLDWGGNLLR